MQITRSTQATVSAFFLHADSLHKDYNKGDVLMVNLLSSQITNETKLTKDFQSLIFEVKELMEKKHIKLTYDLFDFHYNQKKSGLGLLDVYIQNILKNQWLRNIGIYTEKFTLYHLDGKL